MDHMAIVFKLMVHSQSSGTKTKQNKRINADDDVDDDDYDDETVAIVTVLQTLTYMYILHI